MLKVTSQNFQNEVMSSDKPVLLDFWADWCGPCKMIAPVVEQLAEKYPDKLKVGKINVDEEVELSHAFNISSIPTLVIIRDGVAADMTVGYKTLPELEQWLELV